jgi:hypothetical protein
VLAQLVYLLSFPSLVPPLLQLTSSHRRIVSRFLLMESRQTLASASSSGNASSCCLSSQAKTEVLNPHHHHRPPSPDRLTLTLHCYKKVISNLVTLPTTQPRLYFCLLPTQSITPSELHPPPSSPFTVVARTSFLRTTTLIVMN